MPKRLSKWVVRYFSLIIEWEQLESGGASPRVGPIGRAIELGHLETKNTAAYVRIERGHARRALFWVVPLIFVAWKSLRRCACWLVKLMSIYCLCARLTLPFTWGLQLRFDWSCCADALIYDRQITISSKMSTLVQITHFTNHTYVTSYGVKERIGQICFGASSQRNVDAEE